jgi:WD40 repeat protein
VPSGKVIARPKFRGVKFEGLTFSPDGRLLASVTDDGCVRFWDTRTWQVLRRFNWRVGKMLTATFSPDGRQAAAGSDRGKIVLWEVGDVLGAAEGRP